MVSGQFFAFSPALIVDRFIEFLLAPFIYTDMLWIAVPVLLTIFLTEIYFSRYKFEELGWNSAYGNALVLLFVALDLFRYLYNHQLLETVTIKTALAIAVLLLSVSLLLVNFFHLFSEEVAYGLSAKLPLNFVAYLAIILVYSDIPFDLATLFAATGLLIIAGAILIFFRSVIPTAIED